MPVTDAFHIAGWDRGREEVDAQMACRNFLDSGHSLADTGPAERHIHFEEALNRNRAQGEGIGS